MIRTSNSLTSPEILRQVQESKDQIQTLSKLSNSNIKWLVELFYKRNKELTGLKIPQYKPSAYPIGNTYSNLTKMQKKVEQAIQLHKSGNLKRCEDVLYIVLESIHKDEATMLAKVLTNECDAFFGIPKNVFVKAYPELFSLKDKIIG